MIQDTIGFVKTAAPGIAFNDGTTPAAAMELLLTLHIQIYAGGNIKHSQIDIILLAR